MAALGEGYRARVKTRVEHIGDATHHTAALLAWERDRVDVRPVQIGVVLEPDLGGRAYASLLTAAFADPDRNRRAPVAAARELPVDVVLEPVTHPAGLDMRGNPVGRVVVGDQLRLALGRADVPRVQRVVDQRRLAAPALRIRVQD